MIPEAAVEAAARAVEESLQMDGGVRDIARSALEAAAPHMLPEAIAHEYEAGADALGDGIAIYASNLRARAASIRAKGGAAYGND